jgi:hypothetical protein
LQHEIEAGGRVHHVTVNRSGDGFAVSVDGRHHQVDAARIDAHTLSLIVDRDVPVGLPASDAAGSYQTRPADVGLRPGPFGAGLVYETTIAPDAGGSFVVLVGAVPVTVRLSGRRGSRRRQDALAAGSGPLRIAAPMPGKVVRVLVRTGDAVRARQPVVVVEAMKMENELRADRDGTVAEIHTREGMSVEAGALLVVIQ